MSTSKPLVQPRSAIAKGGGDAAALSPNAEAPVIQHPKIRIADVLQQPMTEAQLELAAEAERLEAMARHPSWSQPLALTGDSIEAATRNVPRVEVAGPHGASPVLTVFAEQASFDAPEPMLIRARWSEESLTAPAHIVATVRDVAARTMGELQLTSEACADGSARGQHCYVASITPPTDDSPSIGYSIQVRAISSEGEEREAQLTLQYNQPYARLTGEFKDRVDTGDLVIATRVLVERSALFRVTGSLYAQADHRPLAWASADAELAPGLHWLELRFHGLILRELGIDGPYLLRFVQLNTQTAEAASNSHALENRYVTQAYDAAAFDAEPVIDAEKLAEAAELRARLGRKGLAAGSSVPAGIQPTVGSGASARQFH